MKMSFRWYGSDDKVTLQNIRQIPGMEAKAIVNEDSWSCEAFIPFTAFEENKPAAGDSWRFNIVRNKLSKPVEVIATSMTLGDHHNYNMYGFLKFVE